MPGIEIKRLRQEGKLDEALKMAQEEFEATPTDDWAKRNLAWVYDSLCKKNAEEGNFQAFDEHTCALIDLGVNESESMLINSMGWRFRSMLSRIDNNVDECERMRILDRMFELVRQFNFEKPSETYSVLLKAFLKYKEVWPAFKEYCEWWDFDNFRQEDYTCEVFTTGKKESYCLVERAYIAYSRCLLNEGPKDLEKIKAFVLKLESLAETHPEMDYPSYFAGKLMLSLDERGDDLVATIRPFVRKKKNEFWAWQLLAEAVENENRDLYLGCLLRAVNCRTKDDFLVKIRLKLVKELVKRQAYYHASKQLELYCKTRLANNVNWRPMGEEKMYLDEPWYKQFKSASEPPLPLDYLALTNDVLFGDIPEKTCVVSFVNTDKHIVSVVYEKEKEGFFKYDSSLHPIIGMKLSVRIQEISKDSFMRVYSAKECSKTMDGELDYYKTVEGRVIYNNNKNIYSLKAGDIICFIPPQDVERLSIVKDQTIKASILYAYNKNKDKWMWRITQIMAT